MTDISTVEDARAACVTMRRRHAELIVVRNEATTTRTDLVTKGATEAQVAPLDNAVREYERQIAEVDAMLIIMSDHAERLDDDLIEKSVAPLVYVDHEDRADLRKVLKPLALEHREPLVKAWRSINATREASARWQAAAREAESEYRPPTFAEIGASRV